MSSPCHIELILSEKEAPVKKEVRSTTGWLRQECRQDCVRRHMSHRIKTFQAWFRVMGSKRVGGTDVVYKQK